MRRELTAEWDAYIRHVREQAWDEGVRVGFDADSAGPSWMSPAPPAGMVGWTALVSIEAEPEYAVRLGSEGGMVLPIGTRDPAPGHGGVDNLPRQRRLVTPWEES